MNNWIFILNSHNVTGFIHLKQLLRSTLSNHFYIVLSFTAFATVMLFYNYYERKLESRRNEKRKLRRKFLKQMIITRKNSEQPKTLDKKINFSDIEMLDHAI